MKNIKCYEKILLGENIEDILPVVSKLEKYPEENFIVYLKSGKSKKIKGLMDLYKYLGWWVIHAHQYNLGRRRT